MLTSDTKFLSRLEGTEIGRTEFKYYTYSK
jgi:hypothetical protein